MDRVTRAFLLGLLAFTLTGAVVDGWQDGGFQIAGGALRIKESASQSELADHGTLYVKTGDSELWWVDDGGTHRQMTGAAVDTALHAEMTMNDNATATTITTQNVWYEVNNFAQGALNGWTFANSDLTASTGSSATYLILFNASPSAGGNDECYEFAISVNDTIQTKCIMERRNDAINDQQEISESCILSISDADVIKLEVRDLSNVTNITIEDASVVLVKL